jgi:sialate O-acetylesterase
MPLRAYPWGAVISLAPADWQIFQQDDQGYGSFSVEGFTHHAESGVVELRLVREETGQPVTHSLDWFPAQVQREKTWKARVEKIPAGGLYRLETRFHHQSQKAGEWSARGDTRHFLGVGDLWLMAGQSNSAGYGRGAYFDPPELGIHLFGNDQTWSLATQPLGRSTATKHIISDDGANTGHSVYLQVARLLKRELHYPIGLIQACVSGTELSLWNPLKGQEAPLFHQMVGAVKQAGGKVRGMFWYQGESDAIAIKPASDYAKQFRKAVVHWRRALGDKALPILTVQLNRYFFTGATPEMQKSWSVLREQQRQVALSDSRILIVGSLDLPLGDFVHTSPAGNGILAQRLAQAALGAVYGKDVAYRAPEIKAARLQRGEKSILLSFDHVMSRLGCVDETRQAFGVEDEEGLMSEVRVTYPKPAQILLRFERRIQGRARVHLGMGLDPVGVPMDMERVMPMLAFYGKKVEDRMEDED